MLNRLIKIVILELIYLKVMIIMNISAHTLKIYKKLMIYPLFSVDMLNFCQKDLSNSDGNLQK
jgi:hypothetical protein